jgi:hypothetical protein
VVENGATFSMMVAPFCQRAVLASPSAPESSPIVLPPRNRPRIRPHIRARVVETAPISTAIGPTCGPHGARGTGDSGEWGGAGEHGRCIKILIFRAVGEQTGMRRENSCPRWCPSVTRGPWQHPCPSMWSGVREKFRTIQWLWIPRHRGTAEICLRAPLPKATSSGCSVGGSPRTCGEVPPFRRCPTLRVWRMRFSPPRPHDRRSGARGCGGCPDSSHSGCGQSCARKRCPRIVAGLLFRARQASDKICHWHFRLQRRGVGMNIAPEQWEASAIPLNRRHPHVSRGMPRGNTKNTCNNRDFSVYAARHSHRFVVRRGAWARAKNLPKIR